MALPSCVVSNRQQLRNLHMHSVGAWMILFSFQRCVSPLLSKSHHFNHVMYFVISVRI